jgi:dipeptide/tripeptide permease
MTPANSVHVLWLIPQYILISVGEVMFAIAGLQFSFTQVRFEINKNIANCLGNNVKSNRNADSRPPKV